MKKTITLILLVLALGCNNSKQVDSKQTDLEQSDNKPENSISNIPAGAIWGFQTDSLSYDLIPVKLRQFHSDTLTPESIENIVNTTYPKVQVKYMHISNDTIFIKIPDSEVLTQQMGTLGAEAFMISATFSFTELTGIKYVSYDFEYGDHANPGVYDRSKWQKK